MLIATPVLLKCNHSTNVIFQTRPLNSTTTVQQGFSMTIQQQQSESKRDESPQKAIVQVKEKNDEHLRESNVEVYNEEVSVNTVEKDFEKRMKEVSTRFLT